ncbi:response regulator [Propionibacterium sp.]|uniref:response regulator n=1 Tax=Propionibacterium sp. TaxID=1977903 RepID=UPI0039E9F091
MPIRVLVADDDPMVVTGLKYLLESDQEIEVVGTAGDGEEAIAQVRSQSVDVVLMDLGMPGVDGIAATRRIDQRPDAPYVIALTTWDVDDAVMSALEAGASGFLLKTSAPDEIIGAIKSVMAGDAVLSPRSTRRLLDQIARDPAVEQRRAAEVAVARLTAREREVAAAVAQGMTNAAIGAQLYLAEATIKSHVATIQSKLGVANRVGIAVLAERAGLLRPA